MSRKHNTAHPERGRSRYQDRLTRRGQTAVTVRMTPLDTLRKRQLCRCGASVYLHDANGCAATGCREFRREGKTYRANDYEEDDELCLTA